MIDKPATWNAQLRDEAYPEKGGRLHLVKGSAQSVYLALRLHQYGPENGAFPSVETIAIGLGLRRRAVQVALRDLENAGMIVRVHDGGGRPRRGQSPTSSMYILTPPGHVERRPFEPGSKQIKGASRCAVNGEAMPIDSSRRSVDSNRRSVDSHKKGAPQCAGGAHHGARKGRTTVRETAHPSAPEVGNETECELEIEPRSTAPVVSQATSDSDSAERRKAKTRWDALITQQGMVGRDGDSRHPRSSTQYASDITSIARLWDRVWPDHIDRLDQLHPDRLPTLMKITKDAAAKRKPMAWMTDQIKKKLPELDALDLVGAATAPPPAKIKGSFRDTPA